MSVEISFSGGNLSKLSILKSIKKLTVVPYKFGLPGTSLVPIILIHFLSSNVLKINEFVATPLMSSISGLVMAAYRQLL